MRAFTAACLSNYQHLPNVGNDIVILNGNVLSVTHDIHNAKNEGYQMER